jgi:[protein-PII] uridylyltransferase
VSAAPEAVRGWLAELGERGSLPDGAKVDVLRAVRGYLGAAREHLAEVHRSAHSGSRVNGLHADLMDRLVRRLYRIAENESFAEEGVAPSRAALLAVGGYARREMSIHSDVDLLLLHEGAVTPYVTRLSERIQLWLWDAGLTVG